MIHSWPQEDLRDRCPEVWIISHLMNKMMPTDLERQGGQDVASLIAFHKAHRSSFTGLAGILIGEAPSSGAGSANWVDLLQGCAAAVCDENAIEETPEGGAHCGRIPTRSEHGGAGRTSRFGRLLWCAALLSQGAVLDTYTGHGDTVLLLADALLRRASKSGSVASFEIKASKLDYVAARLRAHDDDLLVQEVALDRKEAGWELRAAAERLGAHGGVGALLVQGSTAAPVQGEARGALAAACAATPGGFGLVLLDPDVEMDPHAFAEDWRSIERCGLPQVVGIYNINLPGGAGWVRERLLHLGSYEEVASGHNDGGADEKDELYQLRAWSLLLRKARRCSRWSLQYVLPRAPQRPTAISRQHPSPPLIPHHPL